MNHFLLEGCRRKSYLAQTRSINALFWVCLVLSGCALLPIDAFVAKAMPMAAPLGPARRIVQHIMIDWAGSRQSMLAVLELDARHIAMAGISPEGLSLFNLNYDGKNQVSDKSPLLPDSIAPESIMADLQLIYWPIEALRKSLPLGWRLEEFDDGRVLTVGNQRRVQVHYLSHDPVWPKDVELVDIQYRYSLRIKTVSYELISE